MNKSTFCILFYLILFGFNGIAQENTYEFLGVIKLNDTAFISYKLDFEEVDGLVQGYSITDAGGPHETKSNISGTYNKDSEILSFKELNIVYTKSPITELDFCLVRFKSKVKNLNKNKAFSGEFEGFYQDDSPCLNGLLVMSNARKVESRVAKVQKKLEKSILIKKETKEKINLKTTLDTLTMSVVKKNENLNVFVKNKTATLVIYDAGKEDDDRIKINVNGTTVLDDYAILRDKKEIPIVLEEGKSIIEVYAINEGSKPPNTVKVEIQDGNNLITTRTSLNTDEKASLTLLQEQ